ncbi:acyltransferase family protein [Yinghuangia sp. ASG 101]|uniref:lysophospholipid acyltransferase family protein n=1 Tax=Yinghuangia sp. ASG 101 TaxID=2896848 RepID=UPI001E39CE6A|nr:lysophospholipid acyltransferase family protein [Yinghuangia sp. ASG 101]UGQ09219.1 acyltransferase family protein [Yinghuangia sp. ASG 101]
MGDARIIPFDGSAGGSRGSGGRGARRPGNRGTRSETAAGGPQARQVRDELVIEEAEDDVPVRESPRRRTTRRGPVHAVDTPAPDGDATGDANAPAAPGPRLGRLAGALAGVVGGAARGLADGLAGPGWEDKAADGLAFVRRRITGDYEVDEFGFDPELTHAVLLSILRPLYDKYFRVEVRGLQNVPDEGGALIVANHSGTLPLDALMTQVAVHDHHARARNLRLLGADLVFQLPLVGQLARKSGHTLACHADAERLLRQGELVGVWPEGFKGLGKPFKDRYKLQRFGRGGFVASALRTGVPIVPCSIVGAEEIYPMVGNFRTLARLLGLPYFPVTPTFPLLGPIGLVPLPTRWHIEFGAPIRTDAYPAQTADDPMVVFNLTDEVRETIQHTIYRVLMQRRSVFF